MATPREIVGARLKNVDAIFRAVERTGLQLYAACAVLDMESEGANIYGGDVGGIFSQRPPKMVTPENYKEFRRRLAKGEKSNGVGPCQITWPGFFTEADKQGLDLADPEDNMVFGFKLFKGYWDRTHDWQKVGRLYNGKDSYGDTLVRVVAEWKGRLGGAPDDGGPVTTRTADQFLAQLKKWGVPYQEHAGWKTHNRAGHGPFDPVGIVLHHTGDDAPDTADFKVLWNGRSDLPGPLCQWGMDDNGVVQLIGWGRANHAGSGSGTVLAAVKKSTYGDYPPRPGSDNTDGNANFYGQETMYSGTHAPTAKAYASTVRMFAAVCDWYGWSAKRCIGHKEWTSRKPDPGHLDMAKFRADVQAALKAGPGAPAPAGPPPFPGAGKFGPGKDNKAVKRLGQRLVVKGYCRFFPTPPTTVWGAKTTGAATKAFQLDHAQLRADADGIPGPLTWQILWED